MSALGDIARTRALVATLCSGPPRPVSEFAHESKLISHGLTPTRSDAGAVRSAAWLPRRSEMHLRGSAAAARRDRIAISRCLRGVGRSAREAESIRRRVTARPKTRLSVSASPRTVDPISRACRSSGMGASFVSTEKWSSRTSGVGGTDRDVARVPAQFRRQELRVSRSTQVHLFLEPDQGSATPCSLRA